MYIKRIEADNYRGFRKIDLSLNRKFTILCGSNGVGKSTVLFAIASALNYIVPEHHRLNANTQLKLSFIDRDSIDNYVGFGAGSYRGKSGLSGIFQGTFPYIDVTGAQQNIHITNVDEKISPLFIGPYRNILYKKIPGMVSEGDISQGRRYYKENAINFLSSGYNPDIKQWMINRYFIIDKDWSELERYNWSKILSSLGEIFDDENIEFSFSKIERDLEPIFLINGSDVYLEELSSGFKSILAIIFSIVEWIERTNEPQNAKIDEARGTVLIDELDAHLHPSWQTKIKKVLENNFPNLQFVITTHSPHIISSGEPGEVVVLRRIAGELESQVINSSLEYWKTEFVFSDIMKVDTNYEQNLNDFIDRIERYIDSNDFSSALAVIDEYSIKSHPDDNTAKIYRRRIQNLMKHTEGEND
ncbi:TPA: AAA family ATPase [Citrobacter freundii]|nr:AAA family ATPase [Citrobacter freundii]